MTGSPIAKLFDRIAPTYDDLNHLLSFNIDKSWRRKVARKVAASRPEAILDVATGTADLAIALARRLPKSHVTGMDIAEQMLEIGRDKVKKKGMNSQIALMAGDVADLPFPDHSYDAVTVAFGVRNFEEVDKGLAEIRRVLRPEGRLFILEFSMPTRFPMRQAYCFYLKKVLPAIGKRFSRDPDAYRYLSDSIQRFPTPMLFNERLASAGFETSAPRRMTFGSVTLYEAKTTSMQ